jgi:glutamyl-tRNA synthetase
MTKLRFAPSPTGYLHVGNVRTALVNWLYARKTNGVFLLRMDDTDMERSKPEYEAAIKEDLEWLGLEWGEYARQSDRYDRYEAAQNKLLADGRLYACYETEEELEVKRKMLLSRGLPPIYDRAALKLSPADIAKYQAEGREPHYRFKLLHETIEWDDLVRGKQSFAGANLSDPILVRAGGIPTYTLSSVVDDGELGVTHVIRGEDHVSNTAVQAQLFEALFNTRPLFGHLSLLKTRDGGISKRLGGFSIREMREDGILPIAISAMLGRMGTSLPVEPLVDFSALIETMDFSIFSRAPVNYDFDELLRLNGKIIGNLTLAQALPHLAKVGCGDIPEAVWNTVRGNIIRINEALGWWKICTSSVQGVVNDPAFLSLAVEALPEGDVNESTWGLWVNSLKESSGRKGKELFMPIRLALTGLEHGPELAPMLPFIGRDRILKRLNGELA